MLQNGLVLKNQYCVERRLGGGGMGAVYLARHVTLGDRLAVKELTVETVNPEGQQAWLDQFTLEARMLLQLRHPHLPLVHDYFEANGLYYLVMDYVEGHSLQEVLDTRGRLAERTVVDIGLQLCDVLSYLHQQSPAVIFRDLKPANIMLETGGGIKLIDFGIAKWLDPETGGGTASVVHDFGTPGFAAPEQYGGSSDVQSDIFSLGATLYTLLTGDVLPPSVLLSSGAVKLSPLAERMPGLQEATLYTLQTTLKPKPRDRPASVKDVAASLQQALQTATGQLLPWHELSEPAPPQPPSPVDSRVLRDITGPARPWWLVAPAALAVLAVAGLAGYHHLPRPLTHPVVAHMRGLLRAEVGYDLVTNTASQEPDIEYQLGLTPGAIRAGGSTITGRLRPLSDTSSLFAEPHLDMTTLHSVAPGTHLAVELKPDANGMSRQADMVVNGYRDMSWSDVQQDPHATALTTRWHLGPEPWYPALPKYFADVEWTVYAEKNR